MEQKLLSGKACERQDYQINIIEPVRKNTNFLISWEMSRNCKIPTWGLRRLENLSEIPDETDPFTPALTCGLNFDHSLVRLLACHGVPGAVGVLDPL